MMHGIVRPAPDSRYDYASAGYGSPSSYSAQEIAAIRQMNYANLNRQLSDYTKAEDYALMAVAPATDTSAYFRAGYWLSVAAQVTGQKSLASKADWNILKGKALAIIPFVGSGHNNADSILRTAASQIQAVAPTNPQALGIVSILSGFTPSAISNRATVTNAQTLPSIPTPSSWFEANKSTFYVGGAVAFGLFLATIFATAKVASGAARVHQETTRMSLDAAKKAASWAAEHPEVAGKLVKSVMLNPKKSRRVRRYR